MWVLPLYLRAREKKLGKPLKELNMCFVLLGRHRRLESELYLKYLKHESLEVAKGCLGEVAAILSLSLQKSWDFFSPKDQIWVDNVEVCLGLSWFLPKRKRQ